MQWLDKYRPDTVDKYVFPHSAERQLRYVLKGEPTNLILYGTPGTGKTTFARLYGKHLGVTDEGNFVELHAGQLVGVQEVRDRVQTIVEHQGGWEGDRWVIHLEECDILTKQAQIALKPLMENYPQTTFILTTNNLLPIDEAIRSRCVVAHLRLNKEDIIGVYKLFTNILEAEGVTFDEKELMQMAKDNHHDLRAALRELEMRYRP